MARTLVDAADVTDNGSNLARYAESTERTTAAPTKRWSLPTGATCYQRSDMLPEQKMDAEGQSGADNLSLVDDFCL